jgi:hypothetical protein
LHSSIHFRSCSWHTPVQDLEPIALPIAEDEEMPAERVDADLILGQGEEGIETLAHIGGPCGKEDARGGPYGEHGC